MSRVVNLSCRILLCLGIFSPIQMAVAADEDIVFVRKDCSSIGSNQQCFGTMPDLQNWLWNTRQPSATSRVSVHIGPGDFSVSSGSHVFECTAGNGYVSLIGSGPSATRLLGVGLDNAIVATDCTDLHVQDMTLESNSGYTVRWAGGGSSRWVNVDVKGHWHAWLDVVPDCAGEHPIHYWFNSRLQNNGKVGAAYKTGCGESWFYASEATYLVNTLNASVFSISGDADVKLFGSVIRAVVPDGADPYVGRGGSFVTGVGAHGNGNFHMHGGIISLDVSPLTSNVDVSGIENYGSGSMHTPGTTFALKAAGTGEVWRIWKKGSGPVLSPFTWPPGTTPPSLGASGTLNGSDMFVETDCDSSGDCSGNSPNPQHPHLMVYDAACTGVGGAWYDMATNQCRQ